MIAYLAVDDDDDTVDEVVLYCRECAEREGCAEESIAIVRARSPFRDPPARFR